MYQNSAVIQALARDSVAELHRTADANARTRCERRPHRVIRAARKTTGWLLIDMGLRLAVPRSAMNRTVVRGQR
jgi:hypothetical protein